MKKKRERLGDILLDLEKVLDRMVDQHDLQWGDVLALVHQHLQVHRPDAQETYEDDNSHPVFYYGPMDKRTDDRVEVYEVWRSSPGGDVQIGLFFSEDHAKKEAEKWNAKVKCNFDKAMITKRTIEEHP